MRRIVGGILLFANIIFFSFNAYFLWHCYPRLPENLSFDYMGIIIGILSLLVGTLVGWQIYKTIEVDKKIESVESRYKSMLDNELYKMSAYTNASAEYIQGIVILSHPNTIHYAQAYETFALALFHYAESKINIEDNANNCIYNMEESFKKKEHWNISYDYRKMEDAIKQIIENGGLKKDLIEKICELESKRKEYLGKKGIGVSTNPDIQDVVEARKEA